MSANPGGVSSLVAQAVSEIKALAAQVDTHEQIDLQVRSLYAAYGVLVYACKSVLPSLTTLQEYVRPGSSERFKTYYYSLGTPDYETPILFNPAGPQCYYHADGQLRFTKQDFLLQIVHTQTKPQGVRCEILADTELMVKALPSLIDSIVFIRTHLQSLDGEAQRSFTELTTLLDPKMTS